MLLGDAFLEGEGTHVVLDLLLVEVLHFELVYLVVGVLSLVE